MKYILFFIIIILFFFYYIFKLENFKNYTRKQVNQLFLNNKNHIYKLNIVKNEKDVEECFKKCDFNDCLKLKIKKKNYNNCIQCQKNNNKCFNNLSTGGLCDDCGDNLKKFNCHDIKNYACPDLKDVFNNKGYAPYYLEIIDKNKISSPYNQSCLFCWNLKNYF